MADAKTQPTDADVQAYLQAKASPQQAADCLPLMQLLQRATGQAARMWGPSIVGYGSYRYTYASGRSGTSCLVGFSLRGRETAIYLAPDWEGAAEFLPRLGPHRMGKGCLYVKRLADLDLPVLAALVQGSVAELQRRHPG